MSRCRLKLGHIKSSWSAADDHKGAKHARHRAPRTICQRRSEETAAQADVVVIAAGFDPETESEGADRTFGLPAGQDELIQEMAAGEQRTLSWSSRRAVAWT